MDKRIFVKKRKGYDKATVELEKNLNFEFGLNLKNTESYIIYDIYNICLLYTSPSPRDGLLPRMPSSA